MLVPMVRPRLGLGVVAALLTAAWVASLPGCAAQPAPPPPMLIADPPPTEDGRMPGAGQSDLDRGIAYIQAEAWEEAIRHLDRALQLGPNNAEAEAMRAVAREKLGDRAGAEQGYQRALDLDPTLTGAAINLGAMYLDEPARPQLAVEVLEKAVKADAREVDAQVNLAYAYRLVGKADASARHYEAALALKDAAEVRFAYGDMLLEAGRLEEAVSQLERALAGLDDFATVATIADAFARAKAYKPCVAAFTKAFALQAPSPKLMAARGLCHHHLDDEVAARADFLRALEADGTFGPAYFYLGMSYRKSGDLTRATDALQKAHKLGPDTSWGKLARERLRELGKH